MYRQNKRHTLGRNIFVALTLSVLGISTAEAAPSVSSVSGSVSHDNNITISGSGFGTKSPAAPYIWANFDDGSSQPSALGQIKSWSTPNFSPTTGVGVRNTTGMQSYLWNFQEQNFSAAMGNIPSGFGWNDYNQPLYLFRKGKRNFSIPSSMNWKNLRLWYADGSFYTQIGNGNISEEGLGHAAYMCAWQSPTSGVCPDGITEEQTRGFSDGRWNTEQFIWRAQSGPGATDAYFEYIVNGRRAVAVPYTDYAQKVLAMKQGTPGDAFYVHDQSANDPDPPSGSRTWWDDIYVDRTWARVMLSNRSIWGIASSGPLYEIQIPTAWSNTSITVRVNQGELVDGATAYVYVVDSNGEANPTGYPVTIGSGGGGDTTPPTSPTNLAANATSSSSISVTWTASTDNVAVTGYHIERCQDSGCSNFAQVGTPTASPFVDSGLTANTFYNYHVRATDGAGNLSGWSNVVGATTQAGTPVTTLTIDNTDAATSQSGSWSPSTNFPGYYGTDYHYSPNATGHWFEWTATTLVAGTYEVYAYWNANTDRPTDVSYLITHSGGTATRNNINQTQNGSQWNLLGTYTFGTTGTVRVQSGGTGTEGTVADAIRFVKTNTVACNTVTTSNFSDAAYNSYGAPFDAFQTSTNLMNTTCNSADTHTINLTTGVTGDTTRIVYTKGYWYDAITTSWRQYTGTCTGALNGEWCQGSVSATITDPNVSTVSSSNPTYLVGMTCSVQGGSWKCGCRDTSCTNFSWQIQGAGL